ncbi:Heterokaryon incompatibility protein (HET) domain containing protein [Naviculisporaceae sp. PSN 640]
MRLINTNKLSPEEFIGSNIPPYAILSHTWEEDEATYADWMSPAGLQGNGKGKVKIRSACELAQRQGYRYIWVDTCCIDKSSSAELTEAINSMFQWYQNSRVCYAYLSDLTTAQPEDSMRHCRWFTRGWTLQELIAPTSVEFYDQAWRYRGDKSKFTTLISHITNIEEHVLWGTKGLETTPVARKMAWAAHRSTTREEDLAYCLLGIFGVNLPLIYGEGSKAFLRLQEEIIKQTSDLSIFCWRARSQPDNIGDDTAPGKFRGVLATSPSEFQDAKKHILDSLVGTEAMPEYTMTNKGVRINIPLLYQIDSGLWFMPIQMIPSDDDLTSGLWLKRYGDGMSFVRAKPTELPKKRCRSTHSLQDAPSSPRYLTKVIPRALDLYVAKSKPNQFAFRWDPTSPYYHYGFTRPRSNWSQDETAFTNDGPFIGMHCFSSNWENTRRDSRFVVVVGKGTHREPPWFCVWTSEDELFDHCIEWSHLDQIRRMGEAQFERNGPRTTLNLLRTATDLRGADWIRMSSMLEANRGRGISMDISLSCRRPTAYGGWIAAINFAEPVITSVGET